MLACKPLLSCETEERFCYKKHFDIRLCTSECGGGYRAGFVSDNLGATMRMRRAKHQQLKTVNLISFIHCIADIVVMKTV